MADEAYTYIYTYDQVKEIEELTTEFHTNLQTKLGDGSQIKHALGRLEREFEALVEVMKRATKKLNT